MSEAIYRPVIQDMTWSYSRISSFEDCPYRWYLKYLRGLRGGRRFFSDYGSFMHKTIEKYLTGSLPKSELVPYYLTNFAQEVRPPAPSYPSQWMCTAMRPRKERSMISLSLKARFALLDWRNLATKFTPIFTPFH